MTDPENTLIKILIVDPHPVVTEGILSLLSANRLFIVDAVFNGQDCIKKVRKWNPDILLLDIALPDVSGMELVEHIQRTNPNTRTIIFTNLDPRDCLTVAMLKMTRGFLQKNCSPRELTKAIRQVYNNQTYFEHDISLQSLIVSRENGKEYPGENPLGLLTNREKEILRLVSKGLPNKEIAAGLGIKKRTVEYHVSNILSKLGVASRTEAVSIYLRGKV